MSTKRRNKIVEKNPIQISEEENSSDDDVPLEKIKKQCLVDNKIVPEDIDLEIPECSDKTIKKKFKKLLDDYEQLKNKSLGLNREIEVLECVNIELKSKIFK